MTGISDRVRRAWCDYDHPDKDEVEIPDPHTECKHGVFALWKRRNAPLQDWLALLGFVAGRAGAKVERNPYRLGPPPNDKQSGEIDIIVGDWTSGYHAAVSWGPANWTDVDTEREAVVAAIDAILDHEQEGDG